MAVVVICMAVKIAKTSDKNVYFDTVIEQKIFVKNQTDQLIALIGDGDDGFIFTQVAEGKKVVMLSATKYGSSSGVITTFQSNDIEMVNMTATYKSGAVAIYNKTIEDKI